MTNVLDMIDNGSTDQPPIVKTTVRKWKRFGKRPSCVFKLNTFLIKSFLAAKFGFIGGYGVWQSYTFLTSKSHASRGF